MYVSFIPRMHTYMVMLQHTLYALYFYVQSGIEIKTVSNYSKKMCFQSLA